MSNDPDPVAPVNPWHPPSAQAPQRPPAPDGPSLTAGPVGAVADVPDLARLARPAEMGARLLARCVDFGAWVAVVLGLDKVFHFLEHTGGFAAQLTTGRQLILSVITYAVWFCYEVVLISRTGRTLGKWLVGIRVVDVQTGRPPEIGATALRWLILGGGYLLCTVPGLLVSVSPWFDRSGRRQGWHDRIARTMEIEGPTRS